MAATRPANVVPTDAFANTSTPVKSRRPWWPVCRRSATMPRSWYPSLKTSRSPNVSVVSMPGAAAWAKTMLYSYPSVSMRPAPMASGTATGWSCYTSPGQTGGDDLATCLYRAAEKYLVGRKIRSDYSDGDPDKEAGFYILNRTKCPAALVECGFMDNRDELEFLRSPEGRKAIVGVIVEGVINYING